MFEWSTIASITGSDGTVVNVNDATTGIYLDDSTGGFDAPVIRQSIEDIPGNDGARIGAFYYSSRPVTVGGVIGVNIAVATRNANIVLLQRVLRGLTADCTIKGTPTGLSAMQIGGRLTDGPRFKGAGPVKSFLASLVCYDPRIVSQAAAVVTAITTPSGNPSGTVNNTGNYDALPSIKITGPLSANWQIKNVTTGKLVQFNTALAGGQYVTINMAFPITAVRDDGSNWYGKIVYPPSFAWPLVAGNNTVSIVGSGGSAATRIDVTAKPAWA